MRQGMNPLRNKPAPYFYKDVIFLVVTHVPSGDEPYHKERQEIAKLCLQSMRDNAHREHTFMIWDNDSKPEFRDWLQHIFNPDILVLSKNIGKNNARASAIHSLPLSSIVCYSDDDIFYYEDWLRPQIDLLLHFPNVAAVSGYPVRTMFRWGNNHTLEWARKNAKLEQGRFISKEYEMDYCDSIGRDYQTHIENTLKDVDYRVTYNDKKAYATAHHCQFIGWTVNIQKAMMYDEQAMGDEKPLDIALDKIGLRLCTTERLTRHMGNVLDEKLKAEIYDTTFSK